VKVQDLIDNLSILDGEAEVLMVIAESPHSYANIVEHVSVAFNENVYLIPGTTTEKVPTEVFEHI